MFIIKRMMNNTSHHWKHEDIYRQLVVSESQCYRPTTTLESLLSPTISERIFVIAAAVSSSGECFLKVSGSFSSLDSSLASFSSLESSFALSFSTSSSRLTSSWQSSSGSSWSLSASTLSISATTWFSQSSTATGFSTSAPWFSLLIQVSES